jgi:tetratricopeptide (TPR) repeat protein
MIFKWFDAGEAAEVGAALAEDFVLQTGSGGGRQGATAGVQDRDLQRFLHRFLQSVEQKARPLKLNFFSRAKLANSFKWKLAERGVAPQIIDELTRALLLRLAGNTSRPAATREAVATGPTKRPAKQIRELLASGDEALVRGADAEAIDCYEELLKLDPRNVVARKNLGIALCKVGRYADAEEQFRRAIGIKANDPEAHYHLGTVLRWRGRMVEAEMPLRRALKLKPTHVEARFSLAMTLLPLGRLSDAKECLATVLRSTPRHIGALVGLAQVAAAEGRFGEARTALERALEIHPLAPVAWATLAQIGKMTASDAAWLRGAEKSASQKLPPLEESDLRFAIGKYYDDLGEFASAFQSYKRANELLKTAAEPYQREEHGRFVDDLIRVYTPDALSRLEGHASDSVKPVFVVGMPRSGTTLVAQIIGVHPSAADVGELGFWAEAVDKQQSQIRHELLGEAARKKLAGSYLRTLDARAPAATRVVDKTTVNSDYLGLLHSVFPNARFIYLRRDPIDTCLSCYFQRFSPSLTYAMDLADLAHYYRQHQRLLAHWRSVLPPGTLLEVPYAGLIADQEGWTRRILEFVGLGWDERCLNFQNSARPVLSASNWQVRQKLYGSSIGRWRNYKKFIGPLLSLTDPGA